jgi:hypothetical protein
MWALPALSGPCDGCAGVMAQQSHGLPCPESQQVSPLDERLYAELMAPRRDVWRARAAAAGQGETKVTYALRRAAALDRPYSRKLQRCSRRGTRVRCGCRGWRGVRLHTCRQHLLCADCQRARARRMGARIRAGLEAAIASRPGEMLVLVTLTLRHSGDVAEDRQRLADGWRRFTKAFWKRYGRFPYVGVWEVTPGSDAMGHVHMHVAVVWPWRDWGDVREMWLAACPESERITFVARRRDGRASDPKSAANYLGKYLSKGLQTDDFSVELRTRVVAGTYNSRWVFSSRKFWILFRPLCQHCQCSVIAAQYRFRGPAWQPPTCEQRGPPQLELEYPERRGLHW